MSRGTLLAVGVLCVYLGAKGVLAIHAAYVDAPTPWWRNVGGRYRFDSARLLIWLCVLSVLFFGLLLTAGALLPTKTVQTLFERWYRPPVTGDRTGADAWLDYWWNKFRGRR